MLFRPGPSSALVIRMHGHGVEEHGMGKTVPQRARCTILRYNLRIRENLDYIQNAGFTASAFLFLSK